MQLQHGLVCAGEPGGEAEDFEHDRVTLERRRRAAGPRAANHRVGERGVTGKVREGLEAVIARASAQPGKPGDTSG